MKFQQNQLSSNDENASAKLAVIGAAVSTLGDAIQTLAAVLALEEASQQQSDDNSDIKELQKQVHYLTNEVQKLKSTIKRKNLY